MIEIIIRGTTNSGKTTFAKLISKTLNIFNIKNQIMDVDEELNDDNLGKKLDAISENMEDDIVFIKIEQYRYLKNGKIN